MKTKVILIIAALSLVACSPNLVNTWNIDKYQVIGENGKKSTSQNIGSITFKKRGKGIKNINYNVFSNSIADESAFTYELHEGYIIIKGTDKKEDSPLNKTWIISTDKSKEKVLKSTDGNNTIQIIELSR